MGLKCVHCGSFDGCIHKLVVELEATTADQAQRIEELEALLHKASDIAETGNLEWVIETLDQQKRGSDGFTPKTQEVDGKEEQ